MFYDASIIILIPAILFTFYAQAKVKSNFNRYSQVRNSRGITGMQAAQIMLRANGLTDVSIVPTAGSLTDNYNPSEKTVNLSESVYNSASIAAIAVACHECGHAIQHSENYAPLGFRSTLFPIVNLGSRLAWPVAIIGILLLSQSQAIGDTVFFVGVLLFAFVVLFHLVTLPVEFNASARALRQMRELDIVSESEVKGAKNVLSAAAMTYVATLATAIANLIRLFAMRSRR